MRILIINGSPKKKGGASQYFSKMLRLFLKGHDVTLIKLCNQGDFQHVLEKMSSCDVVVFSVPLYVDAMPSHVLKFLHVAEKYCIENEKNFKLYIISNNGFIEGSQNKPHLHMYQCWCERSGNEWGGGIGIGGGVMMRALSIVFPIILLCEAAKVIMQMALLHDVSIMAFEHIVINFFVWFLLESGAILSIANLAINIRRKSYMKNKYTRVMIPSFLFIIFSDIFMFLSSLFQGKFIFSLLKKDKVD